MSNNDVSVKPETKKREIKFTFWADLGSTPEETLSLDEIFDGTEEEWNAMAEGEQHEFLQSYLQDWLANTFECGFYEEE